jgi:hypothetical protein
MILLIFAAFLPPLAAFTFMSMQRELPYRFAAVNVLSIAITAALVWICKGLDGRRWPVLLLLVPIWSYQAFFVALYVAFYPFIKHGF